MRRALPLASGRSAWRGLLLLAALLIAVQGLSTALLAARGPLHGHTAAAPAGTRALSDFRRAIAPIAELATPHRHEGDGSERHHHGADDGTVLALQDDAARAASGSIDDDPRLAHPLFLPIPSAAPRLPSAPTASLLAVIGVRGWGSVSIAPPERPPRAG